MKHLDLSDLDRHSDAMLTPSGDVVTLRFAEVSDAGSLQAYFRSLSARSRYNRLMGAASELPAGQLDRFTHLGVDDGFSLIATTLRDGHPVVIGEARYALHEDTDSVEIGLSIADHMQGQGLGLALLANLECRASALGAVSIFGDTLRSNDAMLALAKKAGFRLAPTLGDWRQVRFEKAVRAAGQFPLNTGLRFSMKACTASR